MPPWFRDVAYPGDSPLTYSSPAGVTTKHIAVVTVIETAVVTTYVTTTTTVGVGRFVLVSSEELYWDGLFYALTAEIRYGAVDNPLDTFSASLRWGPLELPGAVGGTHRYL